MKIIGNLYYQLFNTYSKQLFREDIVESDDGEFINYNIAFHSKYIRITKNSSDCPVK